MHAILDHAGARLDIRPDQTNIGADAFASMEGQLPENEIALGASRGTVEVEVRANVPLPIRALEVMMYGHVVPAK